ncbi:glycosyltransferase family 4 protein [Candidatus Latescibacterota bacterium]
MEHYIQAVTLRWYNACAFYAVTLAKGIRALGHRVTFFSGFDTPAVQKAREWGIEVDNSDGYSSHNPLSYIRLAGIYRKFARENRITLVNVHHGRDHVLWAWALRDTGIPLVRTSGDQIPPSNHIGARFLVKNKTAGIIASCGTVRKFYSERFGIEPEKIPVIHGGVDSDYYTSNYLRNVLRDSLGLPVDAFVFGILARFSPDKGHEYFFRAAQIVAKKYPEAWFLVSGWKAQFNEQDMRSMAEQAGISDKTRFTGRYSDSRELIGSIDVGVIASVRSETICRIAMEYMAMGIPVIATDTNAVPEIIRHGETGLVVPAGDPEAMSSAMEQILKSKEKTREFGERGCEIVAAEYSLTSFAAQTLEAYRGITGNG